MSGYNKSGIPIQQGLIKRENLLDKLSGVLNYPLAVLSAPAGCGKTALGIQIAEQVKADVVWHTVSPYEQDPRVFFHAILQSLEPVIPNILSLQVVLQQPLEQLVYEMTSYLRENLTDNLLIVLDDWQILQSPDTDQWLRLFLDTLPEKCHLFIISRNVPALNMIQLIANRRLLNIPQQQLFFTESEVYMLAVQMYQEKLSSEKIKSIWTRLRGWPVGTILALQPIPDLLESYTAGGIEPSESLFQSISAEMLVQQLPDIQHFLRWTSTGEYFNAELCEEVFQISDWEFLLSDVIQQNLFVSQQSGGYQYHQLFRTFLQTHFKLKYPEDYKSAHRRLAGWYQSRNQPDRAIEHFIEADSIADAAKLIESIINAYLAQGRVGTILQLSQKLESYDMPMPNLDHVRAQVYNTHEMDLERAQFFAQRSLAYFEKHEQHTDVLDVMITIGHFHQQNGDLIAARNVFLDILESEHLSTAIKSDTLNQLGMTEYFLGESREAVTHLQESLKLTQETGGQFKLAKLYQDLELAYRDVGDVDNANNCLEKQIHLWRKLNNPEKLAMALNNLGYRYYEQGLYSLAEDTYHQGIDSIANMLSTRSRYYLLASLGDLQRDRGHYSDARTTYQRALNLIGGKEPYAHAEVLTNLATLYRWQFKYEAALTCANDAIAMSLEHNLMQRYLLAKIAQWHIRLQPWSLSDIRAEVRQVVADHPRLEENRPVEFMLLQLRIAILDSNRVAIQSLMQHFTRLHNNGQSIQVFAAEIAHHPDLSSFWKQNKHQYPDLQAALERRTITPKSQAQIVPIAADTHSLHIYTLGIERIRKNNAHIKIAETHAELVREFLYYFVFVGEGTREEIGRIFWEDKSIEARKDNFHQTLFRVRTALGNKIIVFDEQTGLYALNPKIQLWCDALQLESLVTEARRLSSFNQHAFNLWYQASQLTYGEFLTNLDRPWINQHRHYVHKLSIEAWMGLAACHRKQQDYRSALACYEKIEVFAPYHEAAYRARMECCSELGEIASVTQVYKNLEERFARDLQVKPSEQSYQLYRKLVTAS